MISKKSICLLILLLSFVSCGKKAETNNGQGTLAPKVDEKTETSSDYSQISKLSALHTGEEFKNINNNTLSFQGVGAKSTYKAIYSFNSEGATSFKVIETAIESSTSNCLRPQVDLVLIGKSESRELTTLDKVNIEQNTDYTLVATAKQTCKELKIKMNIIAWVGLQSEEPRLANLCDGNQVAEMAFFPNVNVVTAFSSVLGKEKFISMDNYCGEFFHGSNVECSSNSTFTKNFLQFENPYVECMAEKETEKRSFRLDFNSTAQSAVLSCKSNGSETYSESFHSCRSVVLDYKSFAK